MAVKYIVRHNGEIIGTRKSAGHIEAQYKFAVAVWGHGKTALVKTYCSRADLAAGEARRYQRHGFTVEVLPVEAIASKPKERIVFRASGGWGELICDSRTGLVVEYIRGGDWQKEGDGYDNIARLDVLEWRLYWGKDADLFAGHDILDFGSWDKSGHYEPAEMDWRNEVKLCQARDE
jgi:hypothetical protein